MSKVIVAIVGASGSGKTTVARMAADRLGIGNVCSYTTRPMREGEVDGIDHLFVPVEEMPDRGEMIAYTFFGGHHYWATRSQVQKKVTIYVIDEKGLLELKERLPKHDIVSVYIDRPTQIDDTSRTSRDKERVSLGKSYYDHVIVNDEGIEELYDKFFAILSTLVNRKCGGCAFFRRVPQRGGWDGFCRKNEIPRNLKQEICNQFYLKYNDRRRSVCSERTEGREE